MKDEKKKKILLTKGRFEGNFLNFVVKISENVNEVVENVWLRIVLKNEDTGVKFDLKLM